MIATPDNLKTSHLVTGRPLPPVQADMADTYVRELEEAERESGKLLEQAKAWLGEHPKVALGIAIGLGVTLGVVIKRVRKW